MLPRVKDAAEPDRYRWLIAAFEAAAINQSTRLLSWDHIRKTTTMYLPAIPEAIVPREPKCHSTVGEAL